MVLVNQFYAYKPLKCPNMVIWVCILMGRPATGVGVGVRFAGMFRENMFRGMFRGYVSGMFRGILSYCNFGGMLWSMFRGYVSGYVTGYVSRVCNPCALLKPEPPQKKTQTHMYISKYSYKP